MAKRRNEKHQEVDSLHEELLRVSTLVLSSFQGLSAPQDAELRALVRKSGAKYRVVKNTLIERASSDTPAAPVLKGLEGPNAIAYMSDGDPVALTKALARYAKDNPAFAFRAGLVEGRVLSIDELKALATLPSREELYAKLLGLLQAPAQRLAALLNAPGGKLAQVVRQGEQEKKFKES